MPGLALSEIARITGAVAPGGAGDRVAAGYAIDSRLLARGEVFFALKGDGRDGHDFAGAAVERGAAAVVVERLLAGLPAGAVQMVVPSTLGALQALAAVVRGRSKVPVAAITGSNGKTTTKEMLAHILATRFRVRKSPGNFNNHIGLPLSILALGPEDEILVVELGSNHRGEIAALAAIARPTVGVVTNVGRAHVGLFGSVEAVAREKTDLLRGLDAGGRGAVNADDPALAAALGDVKAPLTRFGTVAGADLRATDVEVQADACRFTLGKETVRLNVGGSHNVANALAAVAAGGLLGITIREAARALPGFEPLRMKSASAGGITVIDDTYNANPDSMAAALEVLARLDAARRVLVMGEMLELGEAAESLHREVGRRVEALGIDVFIGIGGLARFAVAEAVEAGLRREAAFWYETKAEAKSALPGIVRSGDAVLVKASRMAGLEEISCFLKASTVAGRT